MVATHTKTTVPVSDPGRAALAQRAELSAVFERFLASRRYILGPEHAAFEAEFAAFLGVRHCVAVACGTDALELALTAVGCEPGEEILTAANAGGYASAAARKVGLRPRFADVDPGTLSLSRATMEPALTPDVGAVVVTHLYGTVGGIDDIAALCRQRGIALIEDCAQAAGARCQGQRAGSFGDAAAFSFYPTKNLGALGDGGALATNSAEIAERARRLRQYGWERKYRVSTLGGRNSRLDELQAAVVRSRLPHLDGWNRRRSEIVQRYEDALSPAAGRVLTGGDESVAQMAVVLAGDRERLRAALETGGIGTDVHFPTADHRQPAWAGDYAGLSLPVTEHAVDHVLTLPCFPELTEEEVERVCGVLRGL